ncbi:unnamed protein product [Durusdinium trenchii]|uniref:Uncharacterized protein n=3 Tax=Durusdinium trenchii TaxID=1381693 RepID=A0ABP0QJZ4_9DINO
MLSCDEAWFTGSAELAGIGTRLPGGPESTGHGRKMKILKWELEPCHRRDALRGARDQQQFLRGLVHRAPEEAIYATIAARQREAIKNLLGKKVPFCPVLRGAIINSWTASRFNGTPSEEILKVCSDRLAEAESMEAPEESFFLRSTDVLHVLRVADEVVFHTAGGCEERHVPHSVRYWSVVRHAKISDWWHFATEFPVGCAHPPLPGNHSGIKVLVLGLAKTGTRTICHALNELGVRAYHSEDFHFLPWWDFVHEQRAGKGVDGTHSVYLAQEMQKDDELASRLMEKIGRCRMEAIALDGLETLFDPLAKANPDAKVIMMNWRTFRQWRNSLDTFVHKLTVMVYHNIITGSSLGLLPWLALLQPLDRLSGGHVEHLLRSGGPPITEVGGPMVWLYHQSMNHRRQYECWTPPSTSIAPQTEEEYQDFYGKAKKYFSKEQIFDWDPRKNTLEELCNFLGIDPCIKKGKVPKAINTWIFERDFPIAANAVIVLRLFLHWVNWKLFDALLSLPFWFYRAWRERPKVD